MESVNVKSLASWMVCSWPGVWPPSVFAAAWPFQKKWECTMTLPPMTCVCQHMVELTYPSDSSTVNTAIRRFLQEADGLIKVCKYNKKKPPAKRTALD